MEKVLHRDRQEGSYRREAQATAPVHWYAQRPDVEQREVIGPGVVLDELHCSGTELCQSIDLACWSTTAATIAIATGCGGGGRERDGRVSEVQDPDDVTTTTTKQQHDDNDDDADAYTGPHSSIHA